jgi:hypothetical protein
MSDGANGEAGKSIAGKALREKHGGKSMAEWKEEDRVWCLLPTCLRVWYDTLMILACCGQNVTRAAAQGASERRQAEAHDDLERVLDLQPAFAVE